MQSLKYISELLKKESYLQYFVSNLALYRNFTVLLRLSGNDVIDDQKKRNVIISNNF